MAAGLPGTGVGKGVGVRAEEGVAAGDGSGDGVAVGSGTGVNVGDGTGVKVAAGAGSGVGVAVGSGLRRVGRRRYRSDCRCGSGFRGWCMVLGSA